MSCLIFSHWLKFAAKIGHGRAAMQQIFSFDATAPCMVVTHTHQAINQALVTAIPTAPPVTESGHSR
jgi:hypothetical protein